MKIFGAAMAGTAFAGLLFSSVGAGAATEKVLHSFKGGRDGFSPHAGLIALDGTLYGTTFYGGTSGGGTVFSITKTGVKKIVHSFRCSGGVEPGTRVFHPGSCRDGANPDAGLIVANGTLYGTTGEYGESGCCGAVYSVTPSGSEKIVHAFQGGNDGNTPEAGLIDISGTLYGTTIVGGSNGDGVVFSVTQAGAESVLYSFEGGKDGANPEAGLIERGGILYGTTTEGGPGCHHECGTVFSLTQGGEESVIHDFANGKDGIVPVAGLTEMGGKFYGTTFYGGGTKKCRDGCGVVFAVTPGGSESIVYAFKGGADGAYPAAGLIKMGGMLYGTTAEGGTSNAGTVFSVTPEGVETVVYTFKSGSDGANPYAGLTSMDGVLYGTTLDGGTDGFGTVFAVTPNG